MTRTVVSDPRHTSASSDIHTALTRASVEAVLAEANTVTRTEGPYLKVLRWLVWLPLLSIHEIARIMQKDEHTVWYYLSQLGEWKLAARVLFGEPGWPRRHQRYYITDLGLYVLVARHPFPLSVPKLAASYAIERSDLLARLARPQVHLVLSSLVSRLLSICPDGYQLTSYQQPWRELYHWQGVQHACTADAALLLRSPDGTEHAYYVLVDQPERLFSQRQEKKYLKKLLELRQVAHLQHEELPHLLLLSLPARFSFWAELLEQNALAHSSTLLSGAIADYGQLGDGAAAPMWLPFGDLVSHYTHGQADEPQAQAYPQRAVSLVSLASCAASPQLTERFSQRRSLESLLARPEDGTGARVRKKLTRYVGDPLQQEANQFARSEREDRAQVIAGLRRSLYSPKREREHVAALLNLTLSASHKTILALLTRHPVLSLADLAFHLQLEGEATRAIQQQLDLVRDLELVQPYAWKDACAASLPWRERERFEMTDLGLRFLAMRHGVTPAHYLRPYPKEGEPAEAEEEVDRRKISPLDPSYLWEQRGLREFKRQLVHANGLYRLIRHIVATSRRTGRYEILFWKSAREALRVYFDPFEQRRVYVKPDAELLFTMSGSTAIGSLLLEYDRGTATKELQKKFLAYAAYDSIRHRTLPRTLVITPTERSSERIRRNIEWASAGHMSIIVVLEAEVLRHGLLPVFGMEQSDDDP